MRLIDADALKKEWGMANKCEDCPRDARKCQFSMVLTRMDICEMLDEAPTVEPQTAKWLWDRPHHFKCSNCEWFAGVSATMYSFCPNCGRKMETNVGELMKEWPNARILEGVNKDGNY